MTKRHDLEFGSKLKLFPRVMGRLIENIKIERRKESLWAIPVKEK
jgi:hypothetical protein